MIYIQLKHIFDESNNVNKNNNHNFRIIRYFVYNTLFYKNVIRYSISAQSGFYSGLI